MNEEQLKNINDQILMLVNKAALSWVDDEEKHRLLYAALEVAQKRNHRMDKSWDLMRNWPSSPNPEQDEK